MKGRLEMPKRMKTELEERSKSRPNPVQDQVPLGATTLREWATVEWCWRGGVGGEKV